MDKRIKKRFRRENRPNKGVGTEAARQAHADRLRQARHTLGVDPMSELGGNEHMLLFAAGMIGRKLK